jgi:hypothetical protein
MRGERMRDRAWAWAWARVAEALGSPLSPRTRALPGTWKLEPEKWHLN